MFNEMFKTLSTITKQFNEIKTNDVEQVFDKIKKEFAISATEVVKEINTVSNEFVEAMKPVKDLAEQKTASLLVQVKTFAENSINLNNLNDTSPVLTKVIPVQVWKTTDGKAFFLQDDAEKHQITIDALSTIQTKVQYRTVFLNNFKKELSDELVQANFDPESVDTLVYFIFENKEKIKEFLQGQ